MEYPISFFKYSNLFLLSFNSALFSAPPSYEEMLNPPGMGNLQQSNEGNEYSDANWDFSPKYATWNVKQWNSWTNQSCQKLWMFIHVNWENIAIPLFQNMNKFSENCLSMFYEFNKKVDNELIVESFYPNNNSTFISVKSNRTCLRCLFFNK